MYIPVVHYTNCTLQLYHTWYRNISLWPSEHWTVHYLPCKDVSTEHTSYYVAKMRYIVDIRQSTRDQNVALSWRGQTVCVCVCARVRVRAACVCVQCACVCMHMWGKKTCTIKQPFVLPKQTPLDIMDVLTSETGFHYMYVVQFRMLANRGKNLFSGRYILRSQTSKVYAR